MKFVQVYTAAHYITLTGEHPIERWKYLPGPQAWAVWVLSAITILCFPLWLSGLPKMPGGLSVWIAGLEGEPVWGDARVWGTVFVVAAVTLTMGSSLRLPSFGGVLTCGLWCLLMVWTDRRFLPAMAEFGNRLPRNGSVLAPVKAWAVR